MREDDHTPLFTVGQAASLLDVQQAFLRRIDDHSVVSPQRSPGGQRRYSRDDLDRIQHVVTMVGEGMTLPAIRRIIELESELAALRTERDALQARLDSLED